MISLIEQTLDIVNEMALTGNKKEDAHRIFNYIRNVIHWDLSKMKEDVSWIIEYLNDFDLRELFYGASEEWREKIWNRLLRQGTNNIENLEWILRYDESDEWKERAWEQILKQGISNHALSVLIFHVSDEWKEKAWEQLLKQNPSNEDLMFILYHDYSRIMKERAWEQLLKQGMSDSDLRWIISRSVDEPYITMARDMLKQRSQE